MSDIQREKRKETKKLSERKGGFISIIKIELAKPSELPETPERKFPSYVQP